MIELINGIILFIIFLIFCVRLGYCMIETIKDNNNDKPFKIW